MKRTQDWNINPQRLGTDGHWRLLVEEPDGHAVVIRITAPTEEQLSHASYFALRELSEGKDAGWKFEPYE